MKAKRLMRVFIFVVALLVFTGCPSSTGPVYTPEDGQNSLTGKIAAASGSIDFENEEIAETASVNSAVTIKNLKMGGKTLTINASGVVLDAVSNANILIGEGVGDGDVTIKNCSNISTIYVNGGGANSIHLSGSEVDVVRVKKDGVRVVMSETKITEKVTVEASQTKLEMTSTNEQTDSSTKIPVLEITAQVDNVNIEGGKINKISVEPVQGSNGAATSPAVTLSGKNEIAEIEGKEVLMILKEEAEITSTMTVNIENLSLEMEDTSSKIQTLEVNSNVKNVNISGGQIESISVKDAGESTDAPAINIMDNVEIKEVTGTTTLNVADDVSNFEKPAGITTVTELAAEDVILDYTFAKKEYLVKEQFSYYGVYAKQFYSNGASKRRQLTSSNCTVSGFDSSKTGNITITITCNGKQIGSYSVKIIEGGIVVDASEASKLIQTITVECEVTVIGTLTDELFSKIMETTGTLPVNISLDLSKTTGLKNVGWVTHKLNKLILPASVTEIREGALCNYVNEILLAEGNTAYKMVDGAIFTKDGKTLIYYPHDKQTDSYSVPEGTVRIANQAFVNCHALKKLNIPASVKEIGNELHSSTPIEEVTVAAENTSYKVENGALLTMDGKNLILYPPAKTDTSYTIPSSVEIIQTGSFNGARKLLSVTIPSSVVRIERYAFCSTGLTSLTFEETDGWYCSGMGLVSEDELADASNFTDYNSRFGSKSLYRRKTITVTSSEAIETIKAITESCTIKITGEISVDFFRDLMNEISKLDWNLSFALDLGETTGLTKIEGIDFRITDFTMPASVTEINEGALSNLSGIKLASGNSNFVIDDGVLYTKDKTIIVCYPRGKRDASFSIPDTVVKIRPSAFRWVDCLENVNIPASVTEIGEYAFCSERIKQITVDAGNTAFKSVDDVLYSKDGKTLIRYPSQKEDKSFTIPDTVEVISREAFNYTRNLSSVTIPSSVTKIEHFAFINSWLKSITFEEVDDWYYLKDEKEIAVSPDDLTLVVNHTKGTPISESELYHKTE